MKKWLESGIGKAVGIVLACLAAGGFVLSMLWMAAVPSVQPQDLLLGGQDFWESSTYNNELMWRAGQEMDVYSNQWMYKENGELNRDASVDIGQITVYPVEGLKYNLGELMDWSKNISDDGGEAIVVCKRAEDGGRSYFYLDDFRRQFEDGTLRAVWKEDGQAGSDLDQIFGTWEKMYDQEVSLEEAYVEEYSVDTDWQEQVYEAEAAEVDDGLYEEGVSGNLEAVVDKDGNRVITDFWIYQGNCLEERYHPQGADSLLELVNEKQWKLSEAFAAVGTAVTHIAERAELMEEQKYERMQDTNVSYLYVDLEQKQAFSNKSQFRKFKTWEDSLEQMKQMGSYLWLSKGAAGTNYDSNNIAAREDQWRDMVEYPSGEAYRSQNKNYVFAAAVDMSLPVQDWVSEQRENFQIYRGVLRKAAGGCAACVVIGLAALVWLTWSAGHSRKKNGVALNFFDKWKTEAGALLVFLVWALHLAWVVESGIIQPSVFQEYLDSQWGGGGVTRAQMMLYTALVLLSFSLTALLILWGYLSLVRRWKAGILWKNSLLYLMLCQGKRGFLALKVIPKKAVMLGGFLVIQLLLSVAVASCMYGGQVFLFFLILTGAAGIGWIGKVSVEYAGIQKGIRKIADGDIGYQIPIKGLTLDRKMMAQDINRVGEGLDQAVEKSVRSERMKTELITNVSHDIKTPLTSIVNYVDLLKREQLPGEHVQEYLDILDKKSQQLKNLTEDVVEASKASTGNLALQYDELDLVEMVLQVNGEFQEKFEERNLSLKLRLPEDTVMVWADGRRMWRILENIYQNAAKYAMPHTRVYVDLSLHALQAVFTMKNISEQPLDISPEELTERFVRGDSSRNTQGSGLGLSIARSLTELQSGEFQLFLDGDLFKVQLSFPVRERTGS